MHPDTHSWTQACMHRQKHINLKLQVNTFMVREHLRHRIFLVFLLFLLFFLICLPFTSTEDPQSGKVMPSDDVLDELCEASFYHLEPLCRRSGKYLPTQPSRRVKSDFPVFNFATQTNTLSAKLTNTADKTTNFTRDLTLYIPSLKIESH